MYVRPPEGGLGGGVTQTCVHIASPVFSLAVHGWRSSGWWCTLRPCGPCSLQVPSGCSAGFSAGSPLVFLFPLRILDECHGYICILTSHKSRLLHFMAEQKDRL
jgi:hypothetical protein